MGAGEGRTLLAGKHPNEPIIANKDWDVFAKQTSKRKVKKIWDIFKKNG